jgi:prefoldin subunit 4
MQKTSPAAKDIDLLWADQQNINRFGKLNLRAEEIKSSLAKLKEDVANLEDASTEAELLEAEGDDQLTFVSVGEAFAKVTPEVAVQVIEKKLSAARKEMEEFNGEHEKILAEMKQLKATLYAKFGDSINLEVDA